MSGAAPKRVRATLFGAARFLTQRLVFAGVDVLPQRVEA